MDDGTSRVGVVVIGRNEGERLRRCIASVLPAHCVYVDSGSSDGSVEWVLSQSIATVLLPRDLPFTAARARNAGFAHLQSLHPGLEYVQFVDGDCEVAGGWMGAARDFLDAHPDVAVVCGRRRERYPDASIFNAQCDREWNTPVGEARACGGDAMMRGTVFERVGAFRESLIAGEEPELCVRLRLAGWRIWRIDHEMTLHDAAILRWSQWWQRVRRSGYAFAEGASLHKALPERFWVTETRRAVVWGAALPAAIVALSLAWRPEAVLLLAIYPAQMFRLAIGQGLFQRSAWSQALLLVAGRLPEAVGVIGFWLGRLLGKRRVLIEYK